MAFKCRFPCHRLIKQYLIISLFDLKQTCQIKANATLDNHIVNCYILFCIKLTFSGVLMRSINASEHA